MSRSLLAASMLAGIFLNGAKKGLASGSVTSCGLICSSTLAIVMRGCVRRSAAPWPNNTIHWSMYMPLELMREIQLS